MITGKLPNNLLEDIIFKHIKYKRKEILTGAGVGEDNALVDFGENVAILSTDPITGAVNDIGRLSIEVSVNEVSASGGEAIGALMTILAPRGTRHSELEHIMKDAGEAASRLDVEIMGGHTEITDAVNKIVISTTVIGKIKKIDMPKIKDIKKGYKVLMTKSTGIEGTSIILKDYEHFFKDKMDIEKIKEGQAYGQKISVKEEGEIGGEIHINYMHDITEGGLLGAVWEAHKAIKKGIKIDEDKIPISDITKEMSAILEIDPLRLISSGSMLIVGEEAKLIQLIDKLNQKGISSSIIGEVIGSGIFIESDGRVKTIEAPKADELYKAIEKLKNIGGNK